MSTRRTRSRLPASHSFHGQTTGIQRFTRSTKPGASSSLLLDGKKDALLLQQQQQQQQPKTSVLPASATTPCLLSASPSKKRKLNEVDPTEQEQEPETKSEPEPPAAVEATPSKTIKFSSLSVSTPQRSDSRTIARHTSRKRRSVHVDSASLQQNKLPLHAEQDEQNEENAEDTLPPALDQLVNFHSAFLRTIGLHFTHKGSTAPADLREILPGIEKLWKKRKVVVKDVQRIVQLWDENNADGDSLDRRGPRFRIANYGLGKVCLERVSGTAAPINENDLKQQFADILKNKWKKQCESTSKDDGSAFVEALPLAPIHESLTPLTALRKGQQRLQDLKGGVIKVKTAMPKAGHSNEGQVTTRDSTADRRKGLLERIKGKELLQAKLGPPPTKEQMLRRCAAQRAEDVARVLALLRPPRVVKDGSAAVQKKPFKWEALIQIVQDSMRNPIPAEEVAACLDILGHKEVAADWIDIVTIGNLKSVVLMSGYDVSPSDIGIKVGRMKF